MSTCIARANRASSAQLARSISDFQEIQDKSFSIGVFRASELSEKEREVIWNIWESNMDGLMSQSSMATTPSKKKKELFHRASRFVIVYSTPQREDGAQQQQRDEKNIAAFSMFRFDFEEDEEVLYCYEVQITESFRRLGLGRLLMQWLSRIAKDWGVEKVMLTCLKANTAARVFYARMGYTMDAISPDFGVEDESEFDYEILSLNL